MQSQSNQMSLKLNRMNSKFNKISLGLSVLIFILMTKVFIMPLFSKTKSPPVKKEATAPAVTAKAEDKSALNDEL